MRAYKVFAIVCIFLGISASSWAVQAPREYSRQWNDPSRSSNENIVWDELLARAIDEKKVYSLEDLIGIAITNNPQLQEAWRQSQSAEAQTKQVYGDWLPTITSTGSFSREKTVAHPVTNNLNRKVYGAQIDGSYKLFDFGARIARTRSASEGLRAANYSFNQSFQDMLLSVETAYYTLESTQSNIASQEANVKDAETDLEATDQKFTAGLVSKLDVLQAKSTFLKAKYDLAGAQGEYRAAQAELVKALGVPATLDINIEPIGGNFPAEVETSEIKELVEEAIKNRPNIASLKAQLSEAENKVKANWGDLFPVLSLGGSAGKSWYDVYGPEKTYHNQYQYSGYLKFDWNMFDGFENINKIKEAKADAEALKQQLMQAELEAAAEVWTKFYDFRSAEKQMAYAETLLETSKAAHELARDGYKAGLKSILDLTKTQSDLFEARTELVSAKKELFISYANLVYATGKLYVKGERSSIE